MSPVPRCFTSWIAVLLLRLGPLSCAGCAAAPTPDPDRKATYPVSGRVLVEDRPLAGAVVTFHPLEVAGGKTVRAYARTDASGSFTLSTYEVGDGAPVGRYAVTVLQDADDAMGSVAARYGDPRESGLTAEVKAQKNELPPFRLRKR